MRALIFNLKEKKDSKRIVIEEREIDLDEENIVPTVRFVSIDEDDVGPVTKKEIEPRDK